MRHVSKLQIAKQATRPYFYLTVSYIKSGSPQMRQEVVTVWLPHHNDIEVRNLNTEQHGLKGFMRVWGDCFLPDPSGP